MKYRFVPTAIALAFLSVAVAPVARSHDQHKDRGAHMEQRMEETAQRLGLTDAQKQQLRPIAEEHLAKAKAIREKYPAEASHEQKRQMFEEMRAIRENYDAQVRGMLDEKQQQEWDRMRAERRDRMREHGKERHEERATN